MEALRRRPLYTSWVAFLLMICAIALWSPQGDLVIPSILGILALALTVLLYKYLTQEPAATG